MQVELLELNFWH